MRGVMPLYHFDLVNWRAVVDAGGADLADDIEAMNSADMVPRDGKSGKRSSRRATPGSPSAKRLRLRGKNARRQTGPQWKRRKPPLGKLPSS